MDIKRIVVDEIPECCRKCDLMLYSMSQEKYYCYVNKKTIYPSLRPSWCPLQVEDECVWKLTYCGKSEEACDYGEGLYLGEYKCTDGWYQGYKPDYTFCPNCGKHIKYVEQ